MLSRYQRDEFERTGLLRLPAAIPPADVDAMRDRFWRFLATAHGIERDRPDTWTVERPRRLQALRRSGAFDQMATAEVCDALDDLLGQAAWRRPRAWGLPLVTFPHPTAGWTVPATGWHVDSHGPDHAGVTVFGYLTTVAAGGGGTAVLPGSHRWFNRYVSAGTWRPAEVKAALAAEHPWLRDLWTGRREPDRVARYLERGAVVGEDRVRVRELTGAPGDVILMHPRTLHAPAPNGLTTPRMMLVEIIERGPRDLGPPTTLSGGLGPKISETQ
jgi:hypothetical protein